MTKDEALKQALEALEANQPVNYCMNSNGERFPMMHEDPFRFDRNTKAITAIKEALAQPEQQPVAWEQFHEHLVERNFCPRCGKRTADLTTIHTCTPPQTIADEHIAKVTSDIDLAVNKALAQPPLPVQRQPLRAEQFVDIARAITPRTVMGLKEAVPTWIVEYGRAIEAKLKAVNGFLKEKNA